MVTLLQTERTYNVSISQGEFTATLMEDWDSKELHWEIWDESGNLVSGKREILVIQEIEKTLE